MPTQLIETTDGLSLLPSNIRLPQPAGTDRIILIPYADALALVNAKGTTKLAVGLIYRITNRILQGAGTMGDVLVEAIGEYEFAPNGLLFANVPDYSNIDSWSVLNSQTRGWVAGVQVTHLGKTWVLQLGASGTQVPGAGNQWVIKIGLTTDGNGNSMQETDEVIYRLDYDWISERKDKRGNTVVASYDSDQSYIGAGHPLCIDQFGWGSPNSYSNEIFDCDFGDLLLTNVQRIYVTGNRISTSVFSGITLADNTLEIVDSTIYGTYFEMSSIRTIDKSEIIGSFVRYNDYMYLKNCSFIDTQVIGFSSTQSNYYAVFDGIIATKAVLTSTTPATQLIVAQKCIITGYKQFAFNEQINGKIIGYQLDGLVVTIDETNLVHKTGAEIIAGLKTLSNKLQVNAPITAAGIIETTTGGVKFPDGTIQITAAVSGGGGTVKSVNTIGPDNNGNVTLAIPADIFKRGAGYFSIVPSTVSFSNTAPGYLSVVINGYGNSAGADYGFIGNGNSNTISPYSDSGFMGVGQYNSINGGTYNSIVNGFRNIVTNANTTTIAGGNFNTASSEWGFLGGGNTNSLSGRFSFIGNGETNLVDGNYIFIGNGVLNKVYGSYNSILNGQHNIINSDNSLITNSNNCSIAVGCDNTALIGCTNLVVTTGTNQTYINNVKVVSGGGGGGGATYTLPAATLVNLGGVMVGTGLNVDGTGLITLNYTGIVKSVNNEVPNASGDVFSPYKTGVGTRSIVTANSTLSNSATGSDSVISGGFTNLASGTTSVVSGGSNNTSSGISSVVSGGSNNIASGEKSVVLGGVNNQATGYGCVVSGGEGNRATGVISNVYGGYSNVVSGVTSFTIGGESNTATTYQSFVLGGQQNSSKGQFGAIISGQNNKINGGLNGERRYSTVINGTDNINNGQYCTIMNSNACEIASSCQLVVMINCNGLKILSGFNQTYINDKLVADRNGTVLTSPNGTRYQLNVSDTGALSTAAI